MNDAQMRAYVCQSQGIERIQTDESSQIFRQHLRAATLAYEMALDGQWPSVCALHGSMMVGFVDCAGAFRTVPVFIGTSKEEADQSTPSPLHVPELMSQWEDLCVEYCATYAKYSVSEREHLCNILYYHFLCIHPFEDGNGRTGRLVLNALRLLSNLPWLTITVDVQSVYVEHLRAYEEQVFKKEYHELYS